MWEKIIEITDFLWGVPLIILLIGVGLYFTVGTKFFQIRHIGFIYKKTIGEILRGNDGSENKNAEKQGQLSPWHALSTVLAGTVGAGNIAGVATAIAVGGPGAVFWMWIIGICGMMTKMAEVTLAVAYRKKSEITGEYYGGPMYYIKSIKGIGKYLAPIYAVALCILVLTDACGIQANTLATTAYDVFRIPMIVSGIIMVGIAVIIIATGGVNKVGTFCGKLVPPMVIIYVVGALIVICANYERIPESLSMIFKYAFAPTPAIGGFTGATVSIAMARGASRGIFSNEAGEGTAATVHATAKTDHPVHQGLYGILEVFIDTVIICTLTALLIITSGVWSNGNTGAPLTFDAFRSVMGTPGTVIISLAVILFTFSSYIGFYVEYRTCIEYLFGEKAIKYAKYIFFIIPFIAVTSEIESVWSLADIAVGFIVIPNVIAILLLGPKFISLVKDYIQKELGK